MTKARAALLSAAAQLRAAGSVSPEADARLLLSHATGHGLGGLELISISADDLSHFEALVARREQGEPVQHITGLAPFRHLELLVGPGVFVARPETESVVEYSLQLLKAMPAHRVPVVVDLGTGSGAIAAAIATESNATVHAVEKDPRAADYARQNLTGTGATLVIGDLVDALADLEGTVDLVISNPPYIPTIHAETLPADVLGHDPEMALFGGVDGLEVIQQVISTAARLLRPGGWLVFEHDDTHGQSAPALVANHGGFHQIADHLDLTGRPRFVSAART